MTDELILQLLKLPKRVSTPPKDWKTEGKHKRRDFRLTSTDGDHRFRCFARESIVFIEDFSIGVEYEPADGSDPIILMRCNGPHGPFNGSGDPSHPHWQFHIHRASELAIDSGKKAESVAEATLDFRSLKEATCFLLAELVVDLRDQQAHFKPELERTLFDGVDVEETA